MTRCHAECVFRQGRAMLRELAELPSRNVSVRVLSSIPSVRTNSTDLKILKQKGLKVSLFLIISFGMHCAAHLHLVFVCFEGVQVRRVNFGRLTGGVLHSKFWIVDRKHVFIGSANMDWRALTQVKLNINHYTGRVLKDPILHLFIAFPP